MIESSKSKNLAAYAYLGLQEDTRKRASGSISCCTHLMFFSPRNEPPEPEDIQELINGANYHPNCEPSTASSRDMESGRGGSGTGGSVPSSRTSTSDQLTRVVNSEAPDQQPSRGPGFWDRCLSVPFLLLLGVTASLVVLPLVLPPLPPPPSMLLLVPVAMLLVLLALAFMPTSGARGGTSPTHL